MTPWTRLDGTPLWREAYDAYAANRMVYHNFNHVRSLYGWAARLGLPYSEQLDENILAHDVIMWRGTGENERASADWLVQRGRSKEWAAPILDTIHHIPSEDRAGLAMLDLMDFTHPYTSRANTERLRLEAMTHSGGSFDQRAWLKGTIGYLEGLSARIRNDLPSLEGETKRNWTRIARGIAVTMSCAPHAYDPHPASGIRRFTPGAEAMAHVLASREEPLNVDEVTALGEAWMPPGSWSSSAMAQLIEEGLARCSHPKGGPVWGLTDAGRDWVARMNAPAQDYPEPAFP